MFEPSPQLDLFPISDGGQTSSSEARPARTRAPPTRAARESMASALGSSLKPSGSSEISDLVGSLLRMSLACELEALTGCSAHWRRSATPLGRSWWVATTSAPIISESACGSLLSTPRKSDMAAGGHGDVGRMGTVRHMLHQAMLPAPCKTEYGSNQGGAAGRTGEVRSSLRAMMLLPTPLKSDQRGSHGRNGSAGPKAPNLPLALSPTKTGNLTAPSMQKWAGARALARMLASHGLTGTAALPITYGWMMGFPPNWLSAAALQAASSPPSATRSSRKSRKASGEQSGE